MKNIDIEVKFDFVGFLSFIGFLLARYFSVLSKKICSVETLSSISLKLC
ncbi:hypothetical protein [Borrelia hermsii]|nr:hypothetical protein [Borrelia hermsii]UCP01639.1 hypothetical protein K9R62_03245 [Borrelia hermsii]UEQ07267.1 hypothetical protein LEQ40_03235 [Borrelia hermsii]UPA07940.1 hypothetical protein bhDAH_000646 [Borrelia hermsii DAH]